MFIIYFLTVFVILTSCPIWADEICIFCWLCRVVEIRSQMASLGMLQNVPQVWIWKTGDVKVSSSGTVSIGCRRVVEFFQSSPQQCVELGVLEILRRFILKSCILPIARTLKQLGDESPELMCVITSAVNPSGPNTSSAALLAKGPAQIPGPDARCINHHGIQKSAAA